MQGASKGGGRRGGRDIQGPLREGHPREEKGGGGEECVGERGKKCAM